MFCLMELNFEQNSVVLGMAEIYGRGYDRTSGSFFCNSYLIGSKVIV